MCTGEKEEDVEISSKINRTSNSSRTEQQQNKTNSRKGSSAEMQLWPIERNSQTRAQPSGIESRTPSRPNQ